MLHGTSHPLRHARSVLAVGLALASPALAQTLHVVDDGGGPGVGFTQIAAAIAAAAEGDAIVVKDGNYAPIAILGKSLYIHAEEGANVLMPNPPVIQGLAAGQRVVLRGLSFQGQTSPGGTGAIADNDGWIGIEDCRFETGTVIGFFGPETVRVVNSTVIFSRCTIDGGLLTSDPTLEHGTGLRVLQSEVFLWDSEVRGAEGGAGIRGGTGLDQVDSTILISGTEVYGGDGGDGTVSPSCSPGKIGGHGWVLSGTAPMGWRQGSTIDGGEGGTGTGAPCTDGFDGNPVVSFAGGVTTLAGRPHTLEVETLEEMGGLATNVMQGQEGELAFLTLGLNPDQTLFLPWSGAIHVGTPFFPQLITTLGPGGSHTFDVTTPTLAGTSFLQFYEQAAYVTSGGKIFLSSPSFPLLVAPGLVP